MEDTYVISDIHLGGSPALPVERGTVDFQMCPPHSRHRLARFVHDLRGRHPDGVRLIVNGDLVDFLAEESVGLPKAADGNDAPPFEAFTRDAGRAVAKLERIVERSEAGAHAGERIFEALSAFLAEGHALHILLGNHDLELTIPQVRRRLTSILTNDRPARLEFLLDGEALPLGNVLVEHGNRYDGWNVVAHGQLRALRARASRDEPPFAFEPPAGSQLVTEVMNGLKGRYRFIDLLKPETEAVIPILTAVDRKSLTQVNKIFAASIAWQQWRRSLKPGRVPENESYVAAGRRPEQAHVTPASAADIELTGEAADEASFRRTAAILDEQRAMLSNARIDDTRIAGGVASTIDYGALRKALVKHAKEIGASYRLDQELPIYLDAAERLSRGTRTVIFGHTHLAKRVDLNGGGTYINTGTWCPTIRVPDRFFDAAVPDRDVLPQLQAFVGDLNTNALTGWHRLVTTFAHIAPNGTTRLCEYHDNGNVTVVQIVNSYLDSILPALKPIVARLTTKGSSVEGTAFLIDATTAFTCEHCLSTSPEASTPTLQFEHWPAGDDGVRETTIVAIDNALDVAILRLTVAAPHGLNYFPPASDALRGDEWASFGYPELLKPDALPMGGFIPDESSTHFDHPRIQLRTDLADDRVNGMSGSPVVSDGRIVGIVANQPGRYTDAGEAQATFRIVYAIAMRDAAPVALAGPTLVDTSPFGALTLGEDRIAVGQQVEQLLIRYLGTQDRPVAFGGRDQALSELDAWLTDATTPLGLLAAPSGRGKTALLARWADRLRRARRARVAFVPINLGRNTARLIDVARLLYLRLRHLTRRGGPYSGAQDSPVDDIARLCAMPAGPGEAPIVIILDGLDEALDWRGAPSELGLPPKLRPHIKVLISYRGDKDVATRFIDERLRPWSDAPLHRFEQLEYLTKEGVAAAVSSLGTTPADDEHLAALLFELSEQGDPLLLALYIDKVRDDLVQRRLPALITELSQIDPGWSGYIANWWNDQERLWGNRPLDRRVATLLGLLASAIEPATREDLERASASFDQSDRLAPFDFPDVLSSAQRFVVTVQGPETTTGPTSDAYTLSHPRLGRFLNEHFSRKYRRDKSLYDRALEDYSRRVVFDITASSEQFRSVYALHSLPRHIERARKGIDEWRPLLGPTWRNAKRWLAGSDDAFLTDVARAWTLADQTADGSRPDDRANAVAIQVRSALLVSSGTLQRSLPPDFVVEMLRFRRWTHAAALRALAQLTATKQSIANGFVAIRDQLSDDDVKLLASLATTKRLSVLRTCVEAELTLRGLATHDSVDISKLSRDAGETTAMLVRLLKPEDRGAAVTHLQGAMGHPVKQLRTVVAVARTLDSPERETVLRSAVQLSATLPGNEGEPLHKWRGEVAAGLALRYLPDAAPTAFIEAVGPRSVEGTYEKRIAEFADVVYQHDREIAQTIANFTDDYLAVKAFARIARSTGDQMYLDRAEQRGFLIGDSLARAAVALRLVEGLPPSSTADLFERAGRIANDELPRVLHRPEWLWPIVARLSSGSWIDELLGRLVPLAGNPKAFQSHREKATSVLATLAPYVGDEKAIALVTACLTNPDFDSGLLASYATRLSPARAREIWDIGGETHNDNLRLMMAAQLLDTGSQKDRTAVMRWMRGRSPSERLSVTAALKDPSAVERMFTTFEMTYLSAVDWFNDRIDAPKLLSLSAGAPRARAAILDAFAQAMESARSTQEAGRLVETIGEFLEMMQPSDGQVHGRVVALALDALRDTRGRDGAKDSLYMHEGAIAAHASATDRAAIIKHAEAFRATPGSLAPWESENFPQSSFFTSLTTSVLRMDDEEMRRSLLCELQSTPLVLPTTFEWNWEQVHPDAARVAAMPLEVLRPLWTRSLREATTSRPGTCRWLAHYAPAIRTLVDESTSRRIASEILELGEWWP